MGFNNEKYGNAKYSTSPVSPNEPMKAVSETSYATLSEFEKKDLVSQPLLSTSTTPLLFFQSVKILLLMLSLDLQKAHSGPPIHLSIPLTHPQRTHDRHPLLRPRQILPHKEQDNPRQCAPMDHTRNALAIVHAARYLHRDLLHEPHHPLLLRLRYQYCEQDVFVYFICGVCDDWSSCHCVGVCNRRIQDGTDGEFAVGIFVLR